ncbi:hypothetical protein BGZ51_001230 [Haplosporangium sp. Z 767]|nr:hypothetical protein BGZ50_002202 [Haplosporangium sp. Z 11]KAF9187515.1 hypothetical protein BGZ51_001230 [Haplosporangium sp. Z 767]
MKFFLPTAILATLVTLLPGQADATFMQFVGINSQTLNGFFTTISLKARMLIDGQPNEINGLRNCVVNCDHKFCSNDGAICAEIEERCKSKAWIKIYYANACRRFQLKDESSCGKTIDKPRQKWEGVLIDWQDFDFWSGGQC